jgi:hypothetical protein
MMKFPKVLCLLALTAVLACGGGGGKNEAPASTGGGEKPAVSNVSKATDDVPTSNRTEMYLDRYRFGTATDADGIVVTETDSIPPGSTASISLYARNAPAGSELRIVWKDLAKKAALGEEVKPVGDKGFVTFKQASPLPEGSYSAELFFRDSAAKEWRDLGGHDFKVGKKS